MKKPDLRQIADGIRFSIFTDEEVEEIAEERLKICRPCEHNFGGVCSMCFCPTYTKSRSPDADCDANKWPKLDKDGADN